MSYPVVLGCSACLYPVWGWCTFSVDHIMIDGHGEETDS